MQVLCSSTLATAQPTACDRGTSLIFNGDDALALSCAGQVLDVIGQIGVDPGDSWGLGATLDHTLRRRCDVSVGRRDGSTPFEIDAEWLTLGVDTFLIWACATALLCKQPSGRTRGRRLGARQPDADAGFSVSRRREPRARRCGCWRSRSP